MHVHGHMYDAASTRIQPVYFLLLLGVPTEPPACGSTGLILWARVARAAIRVGPTGHAPPC